MPRKYQLIVVLLLLPLRVVAGTSCDVILVLSDIQATMERIGNPQQSRLSDDMTILRSATLRLDASSMRYALQEHPMAAHADTMQQFLMTAERIALAYSRGQHDLAIRLARQADTRAMSQNFGRLLIPYPCRSELITEPLIAEPTGGLVAEAVQQLKIRGIYAISILALCALLAVLCLFLIRRQITRIALKRRRNKRYFLKLPATLNHDEKSTAAILPAAGSIVKIVDISCEGMKLSHQLPAGFLDDQQVTIAFDGNPHTAKIMWSNAHFAGLKLHDRLSEHEVLRLVKHYRRNKQRRRIADNAAITRPVSNKSIQLSGRRNLHPLNSTIVPALKRQKK